MTQETNKQANRRTWFIVLIMVLALSIGGIKTCNAQVSDDWGKYQSGDTIYAISYGHEQDSILKGRVTYVNYMFPKHSFFTFFKRDKIVNKYYDLNDNELLYSVHALSIIGDPLTKSIGARYDYLPSGRSNIGFYASIEKSNNWHGSKVPGRTVFDAPVIPENTTTTTVTTTTTTSRKSPTHNSCDPNPCPTCEPTYVYITETIHTIVTNYNYIGPIEEYITATNRIAATLGLSYRPWDATFLYVTGGISLHGYVQEGMFIIPFDKPECKPISGEIGVLTNVGRLAVESTVDVIRGGIKLGIGLLF